MKTNIKLLTLLLVLIMLLQSTVITSLAVNPIEIDTLILNASGQPEKYSSEYNSGQRDVIATTLNGTSADAYYNGSYEYDVLSQKSASEIQSALASLMKNTHTYTSSYNDCHYKANRTDCENEEGSSNTLSLIYTSYTATMSQWNGWNREHVWPKSLGGNTTTGGGADLHHIRPSDASVNSSRGNKKFGNAPNGTAKYGSNPASGVLGGHYNSTYFEPLDNVKGDMARICLYVYVRWGSAWGATSITKVFQSVDVLLEWMEIDPVDTWELGRNEVVEDIQGNRNVFIDYPEYAWLIFGEEIPSDMVTPSGEAMNGNGGTTTPDCTNHTDTNKDYVCDKCGAQLEKPADPECTEHVDNNSDYVCDKCGAQLEKPVDPECKEHVDADSDYVCDKCGETLEKPALPTADDFNTSINKLVLGVLEGKDEYNEIYKALSIYASLSDADKSAVASQYNLLKNIVSDYNERINSVNTNAENAWGAVIAGVALDLSVVSFAIYSLVGKKYV